ncbi:unnamed protein product [Alopecurus aequalis]
MGTLSVIILLCLLLLMPLHLVPGSEARTCVEMSETYTTSTCVEGECVEACHKERFTQGECHMLVWRRRFMLRCFCVKEC